MAIELTLSELKRIYNDNSLKDACSILNVSVPTLLKMLKDNNVTLKGQGNKPKYKIIKDKK